MENSTQNQTPISNLLYDWVTILHSKAEGLQAYDKYLRDAQAENSEDCIQLLNQLKQMDMKAVQDVKEHLAMMLEDEDMELDGDTTSTTMGDSQQQDAML